MSITKYEVYRKITMEGLERNYEVIPEFRIFINRWQYRDIDLVWAVKRDTINDELKHNLKLYKVLAAFEIEGVDVLKRRLAQHINNYKYLKENQLQGEFACGMTILYDYAYDRSNWRVLNLSQELIDKYTQKRNGYFNDILQKSQSFRNLNATLTHANHLEDALKDL